MHIISKNSILVVLNDIIVFFFASYFSLLIKFDFSIPPGFFNKIPPQLILSLALYKIVLFMFFSSYKGMYRYTSIWDLLNVVKANLIYSLSIFIIITSFYGYNVVVFSFLILDFILSNVFMNSTRIMIRMYFNHFKSFGRTNGNYYNKKMLLLLARGTAEIT